MTFLCCKALLFRILAFCCFFDFEREELVGTATLGKLVQGRLLANRTSVNAFASKVEVVRYSWRKKCFFLVLGNFCVKIVVTIFPTALSRIIVDFFFSCIPAFTPMSTSALNTKVSNAEPLRGSASLK